MAEEPLRRSEPTAGNRRSIWRVAADRPWATVIPVAFVIVSRHT
jgi:hypothetical protein